MSFTAEVVAELAPHVPILPCCRAALIEGMRLAGSAQPLPPGTLLATSRAAAARLGLAALHASAVDARLERRRTARRLTYALVFSGPPPPVAPGVRTCCDRSRVRGAFLEGGSVSRPAAPPHLELGARSEAAAAMLADALRRLGIDSVVTVRRGRALVLVRSVEGIGALLSSIGAQGGRLRFEEGRVVRELRAGVNRRLNSETANLRRTVDAGLRQARAAAALQGDDERWRRLPAGVREAAVLRHRHPQDSLVSLASRAGTSRSAMAGRLRRLMELAASP
jgi:DNA-binding transcriptional regulator WhiA